MRCAANKKVYAGEEKPLDLGRERSDGLHLEEVVDRWEQMMMIKWKKAAGSWLWALVFACAGSFLGAGRAEASDHAVETIYLGEPKYVWWESDTMGKWSSVSKAHEYQVKLYISDNVNRDEENWRWFDEEDEELEAVMTRRTSDTSCDFSEYMKAPHSYFFVVRATPKISELAYVESGSWIASPDMDFKEKPSPGITGGKWRNYLEGSRYEVENGQFLPGGWHRIEGYWYLLDEDGYRLTGWQSLEDGNYYLGTDGRMATGWFVIEDTWYYAGSDGRLQSGQVMTEPGIWYDLDEEGRWNPSS